MHNTEMANMTDPEIALAHIRQQLPPPGSPSYWSEAQWDVWYAIADAVVPRITSTETANDGNESSYRVPKDKLDEAYAELSRRQSSSPISRQEFEAYLAERPVENQDFRDNVTRTMGLLPSDARKQLGILLSTLR